MALNLSYHHQFDLPRLIYFLYFTLFLVTQLQFSIMLHNVPHSTSPHITDESRLYTENTEVGNNMDIIVNISVLNLKCKIFQRASITLNGSRAPKHQGNKFQPFMVEGLMVQLR